MVNTDYFENLFKSMQEKDPEFAKILNDFINKQILTNINLTDKEFMIIILSNLIANQSTKLYENILSDIVNSVLEPVEIKELLYQSVVYVGLSKMYEFIDITNHIFEKLNISLPLESQSTILYEDRLDVGYNMQIRNFGKEFIDNSINNTPSNQKQVWDFISSYAYGDFYTRGGLDDKLRELISFILILSLRGCENQLKIHTIGNIKVGNSKDKLIDAIVILIPFIGFPRMHNALAIVNDVNENEVI